MTDSQDTKGVVQAVPALDVQEEASRIRVEDSSLGEIAATEPLVLGETHSNFAEFHEEYVSKYIALADTKAAWMFTITAGLIAYLGGNENYLSLLLNPEWGGAYCTKAATMLMLALSALFSFLVIVPRVPTSGEGVVYFKTVASKSSADDYVESVGKKSTSELAEARLVHCYDISRVCARKYNALRISMWAGFIGLFLACGAFALG